MEKEFNWVKVSNGVPSEVSPDMLEHDFSGYLTIREKPGKTLEKIFFVLTGNGLYYFLESKSAVNSGVVVLRANSNVGENFKDNSFYVTGDVHAFSKSFSHQLDITADSHKEKVIWMRVIQLNIEKTVFETMKRVTEALPTFRFRSLPEQVTVDPQFANSFFGMNLGVMKFGKSEIPKYSAPNQNFDSVFTNGDDIHMCFSFLHAVRNYPAFTLINANAEMYPPEVITSIPPGNSHIAYFQAFLYINGKRIQRKNQPILGGFTHFQFEGHAVDASSYKPENNKNTDFYAIAQTMAFPILTKEIPGHSEFGKSVIKAGKEFNSLPKGEHTVKIDVYYILAPTNENILSTEKDPCHKFPYISTDPILLSSGEFKFISTGDGNKSQMTPEMVARMSSNIYSKIHENFKKKYNIKQSDVWYPDFSRKDITDMSGMFSNADLNGLDLSQWDTSKVRYMIGMFQEVQNIPESIGNWNTSNVTNMSWMFLEVKNIPESIGNWNTSNVTDMMGMFCNAQNIPGSIGNWNTNNVTNMSKMFKKAQNIPESISKKFNLSTDSDYSSDTNSDYGSD